MATPESVQSKTSDAITLIFVPDEKTRMNPTNRYHGSEAGGISQNLASPALAQMGLFFATVQDASRESRNVLGLAPASDFVDLTGRAGPVVHEDALTGREVTFGRLTLENLRLSRPDR